MNGKAIILDSNLLVLLVVGSASPHYLGSHKNVKTYTKADFDLLFGIVSIAPKVLTNPHVLTETSNLVRQMGEPGRTKITRLFGAMVEPLEEQYIESRIAAKRAEFPRLGLTDCAILAALEPSHVLITADFDLYSAAHKQGSHAENFNHLRVGISL